MPVIPPIAHVRQTLNPPHVADVPVETRRLWRVSRLPQVIQPGMRVATLGIHFEARVANGLLGRYPHCCRPR
jgi:hypothetical protein